MAKEIEVIRGAIEILHKELGYDKRHISHCLKGIVGTEKARLIRRKAIEMGLQKEE